MLKTTKKNKPLVPKGWYVGADDLYEGSLTSEVKHSGTQCAQLRSLTKKQSDFGTLCQSIKVAEYKGKRIKFSGYVKTKDIQSWAALWMRIDGYDEECSADEDSRTMGFDNMQDRPIKGDTDWTLYEIILDVPPGSSDIVFGAMLIGTGTIWVDDFKIEEVSKNVRTTGNMHKSCGMDCQVKEPTNLDFSMDVREKSSNKKISGIPEGWFVLSEGEPGSKFEVEEVNNDKNEKVFSITGKTEKDYGGLWQAIEAYSFAGKRLKLSGEVKTDKVMVRSGLILRADVGWKHNVTSDYMEGREIKGTTNWSNYNCVIDIPEDCENIYIGGYLNGSGKAMFKNFKVEEVSKTVATTGNSGCIKHESEKEIIPKESKRNTEVVNSKFLDGMEKGTPKGWFMSGGIPDNFKANIESNGLNNGSAKCCLLECIKEPEDDFGTLMQWIQAKPYLEKRVRFEANVKTEKALSPALWLRIDSNDGDTIGFDNMSDRPIGTTTDWTRYSCVLDVPNDSAQICFGMISSGGKIWFTDVKLEEVGDDVPVTNMNRVHPVNLDFED
ncbi:MAG: hypothetical protein SFY67_05615 [Candidatus Melainabacteria bacterium]|nr:hypothetical protein [Candidatus Melainabacteria bacterium]